MSGRSASASFAQQVTRPDPPNFDKREVISGAMA
jgi:hypothetical protein